MIVSMLSSAWWRAAHIVVVREAMVVMTCVVGAAVMVTFCVTMLEAVTVVKQGSMVCVSIKAWDGVANLTWTSLLKITSFVWTLGSCWHIASSFACGGSCS